MSVAFGSAKFPLLGIVLAGGAWIQLSTWLCLRFFAENEARLSLIPEHRYNGGGTAWRSPDAPS